MNKKTKIEWTDRVWNPVHGCSRVSPGCMNCYAERQSARFPASFHGVARFKNKAGERLPKWTGDVVCIEEKLAEPLKWKKPCRVFVNSMSDLFHEKVPDEFIDKVFAVMAACPHITFQILTKRPVRMRDYFLKEHRNESIVKAFDDFGFEDYSIGTCACLSWYDENGHHVVWDSDERPLPLPNVWLGVSCENQETADERIPFLLATPAAVRFVSFEPLLGKIFVDGESRRELDWAIIGGESGPGARECDICWITDLAAQFKASGTSVFVKQLGAKPIDSSAETLDEWRRNIKHSKGGKLEEWPQYKVLPRQFPAAAGEVGQ